MSDALTVDGPLDTSTIRAQFERLARQDDPEPFAAVLTRYLAQPLSDSETAWAYKNLANVFAVSERAAEAVRTHETFERWLPGKSPWLSAKFPHYPAPEGSPDAIGPDEIRVSFLAQSVQFATAYGAIGRYDDFVAKADAALAGLTPTKRNLKIRFSALRIFMNASELAGDFERAEEHIRAMRAVADQAEDASTAAERRGSLLTSEIQLAQARNDPPRVADRLGEALSLLEEHRSSANHWERGFRHNLAHYMIRDGRHDLALPVLDGILALGEHLGGYGWLMHAAAVWQVTHDRSRTLALLREARDHDARDLVHEFRGTPGLRDVADDAEFLQAISRAAAP